MYLGKIVEQASVDELFSNPRHPYTKSLLDSIPDLGEKKTFNPLIGDVPSPSNPPSGCHFHPRCPIYLNEEKGSDLELKCISQHPEKIGESDSFVTCHQFNP
jgi:peptide/nickel transport system ATP-binding protein